MFILQSAIFLGLTFHCVLHAVLAVPSSTQIVQDLKNVLSSGSEIILTSDPKYAVDFQARFETTAPPSYIVGVKPAVIGDIQKVVKYATLHNVSFLATGGGHGYSWSLGHLKQAIDIDMGNFHEVQIDSAANTVTVGGSVRLGEVTPQLQAAGKELPVGSCSFVGITGFALGGGVGPYGGIHGALSDSILSLEMVTGKGDILTVSATSYPDLFWGMKGAGFNYGIVTSVKYKVYPLTNGGVVTVVNTLFPASMNGSVWAAARSFVGRLPKELTLDFSATWNETLGETAIICSFYYVGPQADGLELIQPFLDLQPMNVEINTVTYSTISTVALYGQIPTVNIRNITLVPYAVNLYNYDVQTMINAFNYMTAEMAENPDLRNAVMAWTQISTVGYQQFPVASSAFPYRNVGVFLQFDGFGADPTQAPAIDQLGKQMRSLWLKGAGKPDLEVYVHFSHGDEGPAAWYSGSNLLQLGLLKARYDPANLFAWYNPVIGK